MANADTIVASALAMLDPRVRDILSLSTQERVTRLEKCNLSLSSSGGLRLPMPSGYENHRDYSMQAFTKFDTTTQHAFMRSFASLQTLRSELDDMLDNNEDYSSQDHTKFRAAVQDIKSATNVMLIEREAEMINAGELPQHSTGHATSLILTEDESKSKFYKKYKFQLKEIFNENNAEAQRGKE